MKNPPLVDAASSSQFLPLRSNPYLRKGLRAEGSGLVGREAGL